VCSQYDRAFTSGFILCANAFIVLTMLIVFQEERLTSKNLNNDVLAWLSAWSEVQIIVHMPSPLHYLVHH